MNFRSLLRALRTPARLRAGLATIETFGSAGLSSLGEVAALLVCCQCSPSGVRDFGRVSGLASRTSTVGVGVKAMPAPPSQAGQAASSLENRILSPTGGLLSVTSLNVDKGPASAAADPRSSLTRRGVTVPLPHALGGDAPPESGPPKFISPHGRTVGRGVKSVKSEASKEGDTDDTEPLFQPHPTDTWVLRYLEAFTTDDLNLRKQFDTTGQQFLARYQALVRKGGPVSDLSPALHGLSLLLACRNPIRSSAAATAASVMRLVSTADTSVMTALFSYARDLTISVIAAGEVGDEFDSDVLAAVQTVALRLAG